MAEHFGLAATPWGAIGGGALTGKYLQGETGRVAEGSARRNERSNAIAAKVVEVAGQLGVPPAQVAINWTRQRDAGLTAIPLVGARTVAQLSNSLGCLDFTLPTDALQALDTVSAIELGFPHDFLASDNVRELVYGGVYDRIVQQPHP